MSTAVSWQMSAPNKNAAETHIPVLVREVLEGMDLKPGGIYVDGTLGAGGHAKAILKSCPDIKFFIGFDLDQQSMSEAGVALKGFGDKVLLFYGNFKDMAKVLFSEEIERVDGVLLDLGISSWQLEHGERGFSFQKDEPLDMRMDRTCGVTASEMVNELPEDVLSKLIKNYGEERWARRIARAIIKKRTDSPILTSAALAKVVCLAVPPKYRYGRIHPATRTFQALRIAVNQELENLKEALGDIPECLNTGGRFCVISFHSLEDRMVKDVFRSDERLKPITKKPITAKEDEIHKNPRARSAKLRVAQRI